jgi:hypothetical protein
VGHERVSTALVAETWVRVHAPSLEGRRVKTSPAEVTRTHVPPVGQDTACTPPPAPVVWAVDHRTVRRFGESRLNARPWESTTVQVPVLVQAAAVTGCPLSSVVCAQPWLAEPGSVWTAAAPDAVPATQRSGEPHARETTRSPVRLGAAVQSPTAGCVEVAVVPVLVIATQSDALGHAMPTIGDFRPVVVTCQDDPVPGAVDVRTAPAAVTAKQRSSPAQLSRLTAEEAGFTWCQLPLAVGLVEISMRPSAVPATHNRADGQDREGSHPATATSWRCHCGVLPPGWSELNTSPLASVAAQNFVVGQDTVCSSPDRPRGAWWPTSAVDVHDSPSPFTVAGVHETSSPQLNRSARRADRREPRLPRTHRRLDDGGKLPMSREVLQEPY